jgi:hypothetical protein
MSGIQIGIIAVLVLVLVALIVVRKKQAKQKG